MSPMNPRVKVLFRVNPFACFVCGQVPRMFWTFGGGWWSSWEEDHQICPGCSLWLFKEFGVMCSKESTS